MEGFIRRRTVPAMLGRALLDLLFPPLCHVCKRFIPSSGRLHLCRDCLAACAAISTPHCSLCGLPFSGGSFDHRCGPCTVSPPPYNAARSAFRFDGPVRDLIHRYKYSHEVRLRRPLGLMAASPLGDFAAKQGVELIVPVPLHVRRLRLRGFNQAVLLGEVLESEWQIPLERSLLQRIRWTEPQVNVPAAERAANVRGAFAVANPEKLAEKRVLLVDDVYTTGSTVAECARVLRRAGAASVAVVTVARAVR